MTDRTDHYAAAELMLDDANVWAAQAGELDPEASERACLAYAAVHALLAIHDTLTAADPTPTNPLTVPHPWPPWPSTPPDADAADRYAANEAKQREAGGRAIRDLVARSSLGTPEVEAARAKADPEAVKRVLARVADPEPDPLALDEAECSRCGTTYPSTDEATLAHHRACTGETPENPMGDPLDEDDHRDRLDRDGECVQCEVDADGWLVKADGRPVYIAPDATPDGADDAPEPLLCPECGHGIDDHGWDEDYAIIHCLTCYGPNDCRQAPSDIARHLIASAVKAEREAGTDG